jgi:hypothetical protein
MKRRCGWLPAALATPPRIVWARKNVSTQICPKSFLSADSITWLEEFLVWKRLGSRWLEDLTARQTQAFLLLEGELAAEGNHEQE